jgi:hypothetical protein
VSETAAALCGSMAAIAASGTEQEEAWRGGPSPLDPHAERAGEGVHRPELAREQRRWATLLGRRPRAETAAADSKSVWGKVGGHNRPQGVGGRRYRRRRMSVPGALQTTITMVGRGFIEEETELARQW